MIEWLETYVDVNFNRRVHRDNAQATDDLRVVADLLTAQQQLVVVVVPALVEALETLWRQTDRGRGSEVEIARVEKVEEGVLENFSPDFEVLEVGAALGQATDNSVGNLSTLA